MKRMPKPVRLLFLLALLAGFAALSWARWFMPIPYPLPTDVQVQIFADVFSNQSQELLPEQAEQVAELLGTFKVRRGFPSGGSYIGTEAVTLTINSTNAPYFSHLYSHRDKPHASWVEILGSNDVQGRYHVENPEQALAKLAELLSSFGL